MNLFTKQKQAHRHKKQTYGYPKGKIGERINQEFGINIHILLCVKYLINKDLLCSTGNSTQYIIIYMGKESEKEQIHVYVQLNHFAAYLKLSQHIPNYTKI